MWLLFHPALVALALLLVGRASAADPSARGWLPLALIKALGIAGGLQLVRLLFTHSAWTIDSMELFSTAMIAGFVLLVALVVAGVRASGWRAMAGWLLLASFGALASSLAFVRDLNMALDFHAPVTREMRIQNLESSTTMRGGTNRYIRLPDWTNEGQARDYDISKGQYDGFAIGQNVAFEEHPGALGFRWLGNLRVAAK